MGQHLEIDNTIQLNPLSRRVSCILRDWAPRSHVSRRENSLWSLFLSCHHLLLVQYPISHVLLLRSVLQKLVLEARLLWYHYTYHRLVCALGLLRFLLRFQMEDYLPDRCVFLGCGQCYSQLVGKVLQAGMEIV